MPANGLLREKVVSYLSGLSPAARKMLLRQLESSAGSGGSTIDDVRTILEAAREVEAAANRLRPAPAPGRRSRAAPLDVKQFFFEPFRAHLIDERLSVHQRGWITRSSLDGIWTYMVREVLPDGFSAVLDLPMEGLAGDEHLENRIRDLRVEAFARFDRIVADAADDGILLQRAQSRLGGPAVYQDLLEMLLMRERLVALDRLASRLPANINMGEASEALLSEQLIAHVQGHPDDAVYVATSISDRLSNPAVLARIAATAARSDEPADVRRAGFAAFVDVALANVERIAMSCAGAIKARGSVAMATVDVRRFHDAVRAISTAVKLEEDTPWRGRMSGLRREMSDVIGAEVESLVPLVRRALHLEGGARPSISDAMEAEKAVAVFAMARRCRDSFALNEALNRVGPIAEQAVDLYGRELFERIRRARGEAIGDLVAISEHLLRMADYLQGDDYAQSMRRFRDKAMKDAAEA